MNTFIKNMVHCALMATGSTFAAPVLVTPNGNFEAGMTSWFEANSGGGAYTYNYPAAGGNPDGYGVIDNTVGGGYGIWIANDDKVIPLVNLGLTAGQTYTFKQDMITLVSGTGHKGGIKIESWAAGANIGDSGDKFATTESATWATYNFDYTIVPGADGIKVVPLWGENASVGYDNIRVENVPVYTPSPSLIIPNGNFEDDPPSNKWVFFQDAGHTVSYQATGGNPNGRAVINSFGVVGGFAVLVANSGAGLPLSSLGLTAGQTYTFTQDMQILQGTTIGGLKVEFLPTSLNPNNTGDMYPTLIGTGATWETYSFQVTIPPGTSSIKVVPLWAPGSEVAYDNFKIVLPVNLAAPTIKLGTIVSWTASSAVNTYQPQESANNVAFTNLGPALTGNAVTSVFDPVKSPFYRVLETTPSSVTNTLAATNTPGVEVSFATVAGANYQVESSNTLTSWLDFGSAITGDGTIKAVIDPLSPPKKFYRVERSTP